SSPACRAACRSSGSSPYSRGRGRRLRDRICRVCGEESSRHARVRILPAMSPIDELDQTGAGAGVIRVLAPLAVEVIECPPTADPKLRGAIGILLSDPVGIEPHATRVPPTALHPGEGIVEDDVSFCRGERHI